MQRVPRSVQALQAPPKMAHRRVVEVMSAWLVEDFDPKLAPWLLTCKDATALAQHCLNKERKHKDEVLRWVIEGVHQHLSSYASVYSKRIWFRGERYCGWRDDVIDIDEDDREAVTLADDVCYEIETSGDGTILQKQDLLRRLERMIVGHWAFEEPHVGHIRRVWESAKIQMAHSRVPRK